MRICIDTNVLVQMFGRQQPYRPLREALTGGQIELAVSNDILMEYEETITRLSGAARWEQVELGLTRFRYVELSSRAISQVPIRRITRLGQACRSIWVTT